MKLQEYYTKNLLSKIQSAIVNFVVNCKYRCFNNPDTSETVKRLFSG